MTHAEQIDALYDALRAAMPDARFGVEIANPVLLGGCAAEGSSIVILSNTHHAGAVGKISECWIRAGCPPLDRLASQGGTIEHRHTPQGQAVQSEPASYSRPKSH